MPYLTPILTSGIACAFPARALRAFGDVPARIPRDVRSAGMDLHPSGESGATSFPRERGGAQERDVRRAGVDLRRSGESGAPSSPRERGGAQERDVRRATLARCPSHESESTPSATTRLPATGFTTPSPIPTRHRTRRLMRRRATRKFEFRLYSPPHMA